MIFDSLDKKIIQYLSAGTSSYQELARNCKVTRNTVYRRIATLEKRGIIKNIICCIVNLEHLDISPICISAKIPQTDQDNAFHLLAAHRNVRFLWRTYGDKTLALLAFCPKGKEGDIIQSIKTILEESNAEQVSVSIGFVWEKSDLTSIDDQLETEKKLEQVLENRM